MSVGSASEQTRYTLRTDGRLGVETSARASISSIGGEAGGVVKALMKDQITIKNRGVLDPAR